VLPPLISRADARRKLNLPIDTCIVTLAARIARWKGHAIFLRAFAELAPHYPQLYGLIVGGYSEADDRPGPLGGGKPYYRELLALTEELGLTGRVTFAGHMEAIMLALTASDIVAHTSTLPEPFGRAIVGRWRPRVRSCRAGGVRRNRGRRCDRPARPAGGRKRACCHPPKNVGGS
jgi:glycosyltransferase involved in cell wall biosynthesis